jgi:hypothetical protein
VDTNYPRITQRAAAMITHLMTMVPERDRDKYLPVITWIIQDSLDVDFVPGPWVGVMEIERIPAEMMLRVHGIRLAFNLDEPTLEKYRNCVLDYMGGRFVFIDQTMSDILNRDG